MSPVLSNKNRTVATVFVHHHQNLNCETLCRVEIMVWHCFTASGTVLDTLPFISFKYVMRISLQQFETKAQMFSNTG